MRLRIASALALLVVGLIAVERWPRERRDRGEPLGMPAARSSQTQASAPIAPLPPSLRESDADGELALGAGGHFAPTPAALAFFDYFLSARGEEPQDDIRARIEAEVARRLPAVAGREALALLDRYLAYRGAALRAASDERIAASADLERRLQWLRELRRAHFGAALASTLFGDEERAVEAALERRRVASDASLSDAEKQSRLQALEEALPAPARTARETATLPLRLAEQERASREAGASEGELRALREGLVGAEAADRLAALDQRRAEWGRRLDAYRSARDALLAEELPTGQRAAELEALRARLFDARERLRVRTIDAVELGSSPSALGEPEAR